MTRRFRLGNYGVTITERYSYRVEYIAGDESTNIAEEVDYDTIAACEEGALGEIVDHICAVDGLGSEIWALLLQLTGKQN